MSARSISLIGTLLPILLASAAARSAEPLAYAIVNPSSAGTDYDSHRENLQVVWRLLRNGFDVHWIRQPCEVGTSQGARKLARGDFAVSLAQEDRDYLRFLLEQGGGPWTLRIDEPFDCRAYPLRYPRILLDAQSWAGNYNWYVETLTRAGLDFDQLYEHSEDSFDPKRHNVFVVPGGGGHIPLEYNRLLAGYVDEGGNYIGSCWGGAQALYPSKVSYGSGNGASLADAHNDEISRSFGALGGIGPVRLENLAPEHPLMWHLPDQFETIYWNGPVMRTGEHALSVARLSAIDASEFRYHSADPALRELDVSEELGKSLFVVSQRPGDGRVIVFGGHPEATDRMSPFDAPPAGERVIWNALLYAVCGSEQTLKVAPTPDAPDHRNAGAEVTRIDPARLTALAGRAAELRSLLVGSAPTPWNEDDQTGCYLGLLDAALDNVSKRATLLHVPADSPRSRAIAARVAEWIAAAETTLAQLAPQLDADLLELRRSAWFPLAGPALERSAELNVLVDDVAWLRRHQALHARR